MHNLWFRAATAVLCGKEEGIFRGKKELLTRQTEAMFMKKRKLQSYMPTNWHNVSKLHTWSEIGIMFKSYITTIDITFQM